MGPILMRSISPWPPFDLSCPNCNASGMGLIKSGSRGMGRVGGSLNGRGQVGGFEAYAGAFCLRPGDWRRAELDTSGKK